MGFCYTSCAVLVRNRNVLIGQMIRSIRNQSQMKALSSLGMTISLEFASLVSVNIIHVEGLLFTFCGSEIINTVLTSEFYFCEILFFIQY